MTISIEMAVKSAPRKAKEMSTGGGPGYGARTILFNDNVHTFEEVAYQLTRAIRCSLEQGMALANVVHNVGQAVVYSGHLERCEAVAEVLQEIKLKVTVER